MSDRLPIKHALIIAVLLSLLVQPVQAKSLGILSGPGWRLEIVAQRKGCRDCVTTQYGQATLFREAYKRGQYALLAHDWRSGALWHPLKVGDSLWLDDREFTVVETFAWYPPGKSGWGESDVYWYVYDRPGWLTLQTCYGAGYWFVIAYERQ